MDSTQQQIKDMMQQLKDASDRQIEREQVFAEHAEQRFRDNLAAFRKFIQKSLTALRRLVPISHLNCS